MKGIPVTPNRQVSLHFNTPEWVMLEPGFTFERMANQMVRTDRPFNHVNLVFNVGWRLLAYADNVSINAERTSSLTPVAFTTHGNFSPLAARRQPNNTLQLNVLDGASADIITTGDNYYYRSVSAGADWNSEIADGAGYLAIRYFDTVFDTNVIVMDRVAVSSDTDKEYQSLIFRFVFDNYNYNNKNEILNFYFNGPANYTGADARRKLADETPSESYHGTGQYQLQISGSGLCVLREKCLDVYPAGDPLEGYNRWPVRFRFRINKTGLSMREYHSIAILKIGNYPSTDFKGKKGIIFKLLDNEPDGVGYSSPNFKGVKDGTEVSDGIAYWIYDAGLPCYETQMRVDMRRDVVGGFAVRKFEYFTEGFFDDDPFTLPFYPVKNDTAADPPNTGKPFILTWDAWTPPGTTVEGFVYDRETGQELNEVFTAGPITKYYEPLDFKREYYVRFEFTGTSEISPILKSYKLSRLPFYLLETHGGEIILSPEEIDKLQCAITGQSRFPESRTANFTLDNLDKGQNNVINDLLKKRGRISFAIKTTWDPSDPTNLCTLFRGYIQRNDAQPKPFTGAFPNRHLHVMRCSDMFGQRLEESLSNIRQSMFSYTTGQAYTVDVAIKTFLNFAGFPDDMLDIPTRPLQLFVGSEVNVATQVEPGTPYGDVVKSLITQYLADYLWADDNGGDYGKLRLKEPTVSPYEPVCAFDDGSNVNVTYTDETETVIESWAPIHSGTGYVWNDAWGETPRQVFPIIKNTFTSWVQKPKFNVLVVSAVGQVVAGNTNPVYTKVFVNWKSADFGNGLVDYDSPDYLGAIVPEILPQLTFIYGNETKARNGINFVGRRLMDLYGRAYKYVTFQAPLVLIPHEDEEGKVRPLKYQDPVLVMGETFLIKSVHLMWAKGFNQMAMYECIAPLDSGEEE